MLRTRFLPLAAAFLCGLIPFIARVAIVKADPPMNGPCTAVVTGCTPPGPTANGCRDGNTPGGTYSGSSCEIVTVLNVFVCSEGTGDCWLHSGEKCAHLDEYLAANCQGGACVGGVFNGTTDFYRPTCAS
jgi:hypothetical protein